MFPAEFPVCPLLHYKTSAKSMTKVLDKNSEYFVEPKSQYDIERTF